jgi:hypothetical protein
MYAIPTIPRAIFVLALLCHVVVAAPSPSSSPVRRQSGRCNDNTFPSQSLEVGPGSSKARGVVVKASQPSHLSRFSPEACSVHVTFKAPNSGNDINFEVYLPAPDTWKAKFLTVGNGGFAGQINTHEMYARFAHGFAVMSTDTGHASQDIRFVRDATGTLSVDFTYAWALNAPEKQDDWAWRSMQYSVPMAKKVVELFYGNESAAGYKSYYSGCSTGGRQGLKHLELNPDYFNGYLIGAPADNRSLMPWISYVQTINSNRSTAITSPVASVIRSLTLATCDLNAVGEIDDSNTCT